MYLNNDPGLAGLGKKLKKLIKPVAHVAAAVATGGASLAVTAAMLAAKKQKEAQAAAAAEAARQEQAMIKQLQATAVAPPAIAPTVVPPSGSVPTFSVAPAPSATPTMAPTGFIQREAVPAPMTMSTGGQQPAWLMPALLVGGGLLVATMMRGGSKQ